MILKLRLPAIVLAFILGLILVFALPSEAAQAEEAMIPTVSTTGAVVTGTGTVEAAGMVTSSGTGGPVIERGFVYGTAIYPTTGGAGVIKVTAGSGTGSFSATLTGLAANTLYYVRGYAINVMGTSYGREDVTVTIVPAITGVTADPAILPSGGGASQIALSGIALPEGITIGAASGSTLITGTTWGSGGRQVLTIGFPANTGGADKIYTIYASLDGVTPSPFTATVTVGAGSSAPPPATPSAPPPATPSAPPPATPSVPGTENPPFVLTNPGAGKTANGTIVSDNGSAVTERGFVYGKEANPFIGGAGVTKLTAGSGTGNFSATLNGLEADASYYVRAYAMNAWGVNYGADVQYTTGTGGLDDVPRTGDTGGIPDAAGIAGLTLLAAGGILLLRRRRQHKA